MRFLQLAEAPAAMSGMSISSRRVTSGWALGRSILFRIGTSSRSKQYTACIGRFCVSRRKSTGNHGKSLTAGFPWILSDMQSGSSTSLCRKALHWLCPAQRFTITNKNPRRQTRCEEQCKYSLLCQNQDVWSLPNRKLVTPVVTANQKKR